MRGEKVQFFKVIVVGHSQYLHAEGVLVVVDVAVGVVGHELLGVIDAARNH